MTRLGAINSNVDLEVVAASDYDEATGQSTTSATLEAITGLTFDLTVPTGIPSTARIAAVMTVQASTTGGSAATGAWDISINSVDGTELQRYLSGVNDTGILAVQARLTGLAPGNYTVVGRHRRVSGVSTVNSDVAQLSAKVILE